MIKINYGFLFQDENDDYYQSSNPPQYLVDVFSYMTHQLPERIETSFPWGAIYTYEMVLDNNTTFGDILLPYIDYLKCNRQQFFSCSSMAYVKIRNELISVLDYSIPVINILEDYGETQEMEIFLVFSDMQGVVYKEGQLRFYMNSHESCRHHLPHVHVSSGEGRSASINIMNGEIIEGNLSGKHVKIAKKIVKEKQELMVLCWNKMTDGLQIDINYALGLTKIKTHHKAS